MKVCGRCSRELPANNDHFDADASKRDGFKVWCKDCRKERRELQKAKDAAALLETLDKAVVANLSEFRPGGTNVPHAAEIYQHVMSLMGGVQGFAMHYAGTFIAAPPGSQTRERMLANMLKLGQAVSDDKKIDLPPEMMTDKDLDKAIEERESRLRVIPQGEVHEVPPADLPDTDLDDEEDGPLTIPA